MPGGCMARGVCMARGCAWLRGPCVTRGHAWLGTCVLGVHAWPGACVAGGNAWWGACVAGGHACPGGVHGRAGVCVAGGMHGWGEGGTHGRRDGHCSGWHASYWNAFLLNVCEQISNFCFHSQFEWITRYQWQIQDFPWEGVSTPKVGVLTYYFAFFLLKTAWK